MVLARPPSYRHVRLALDVVFVTRSMAVPVADVRMLRHAIDSTDGTGQPSCILRRLPRSDCGDSAVAGALRHAVHRPCCGYPTLDERSSYDICYLCWWEDEGQDDPDADTVAGGPNAHYRLTTARENFANYLVMYEPDKDRRVRGRDSAEELQAKRQVIAALDALKSAEPTQHEPLWQQVVLGERTLRHLLNIRIP